MACGKAKPAKAALLIDENSGVSTALRGRGYDTGAGAEPDRRILLIGKHGIHGK
jgi:hypothetical protein